MIPAHLKFYKLIVEELSSLVQNAEVVQEESDEVRSLFYVVFLF